MASGGGGSQGAEKQQFNIYLPPELVKALKHRAIEEGTSLSALVEQIFRAYLDQRGEPEWRQKE